MEAMGGQSQPAHEQQTPPYPPRQRTTSHPPSFPRPDLDDSPLPRRTPPQSAQQQYQPPPGPPPGHPPRQQQQQRPDYYTHGQSGSRPAPNSISAGERLSLGLSKPGMGEGDCGSPTLRVDVDESEVA